MTWDTKPWAKAHTTEEFTGRPKVVRGSPQSVKRSMGEAAHKLQLKKAHNRYWWKPRSPGEGSEARGTGKPGGGPVIDISVFACLGSIAPFLGNFWWFPLESYLFFRACGAPPTFLQERYQANELQFGEMYGTTGKEKVCFGAGWLEGCTSEVTNGHLTTKGEYGSYTSMWKRRRGKQRQEVDMASASSYARS